VPVHPLDVLCQQVLGLASAGPCVADEVFDLVRRAYPFRDLPRRDFDDCLTYLHGQDRDGRPWLPARLRGEAGRFTVRDRRTARLLRRNLGTILAEEPTPVLLSEHPAPRTPLIGQVDQAFAERLEPGDRFLLDGRCLEYRRREEGALLVEEVSGRPAVPRWGGEGWPLSPELARRLYLLRVQAAEALHDGPANLAALLRRDYGLGDAAAEALTAFFVRQECVSEIPDGSAVLVEAVAAGEAVAYYLHTPLNRTGNDALARVAAHRLARDHGRACTSIVADLGLSLHVRGRLPDVPDLVRTLLSADGFDAALDAALADSAVLRERFRRVALTGLMLLRNPLGRRRQVGGPDWGERRLFDQVRAHDGDFVLLRQAAREVRADPCDATAARGFVEELPRRALRCRWLPRPSPFVEGWTQLAPGPASAVETPAEALQRLHASLTGEGEPPID
jgi:ATP-dependent Lhr-like helicase